MKMYKKLMSQKNLSKRETDRTFELAMKEVIAIKDGDKLVKLATRYSKRSFGADTKNSK